MKQIPGVTVVHVHLNKGLAVIRLAPANHVSLVQVRQGIHRQGFDAKSARVAAAGRLSGTAGHLMFQVTNSPDRFHVVATSHANWGRYAGKTVLVHGLVPAGMHPGTIQITSAAPAGKT